jgi:hypothetical protein
VGFTGSIGGIGYTGSLGDTGFTGSQSTVPGFTGSQGDIGYTGSQGLSLSLKSTVSGIGDLPATGNVLGDLRIVDDIQYLYGWNGTSWYAIGPAIIGYTGSQGIPGNPGLRGFTGSQGDLGYTGSQGNIGFTGSEGDVGFTGSKGDIGYTGSQGLISRTILTGASSSLANGAVGNIDITGYKSYALLQLGSSVPARIRVYSSSTARSNDANRPEGVDPSSGIGLITDIVTDTDLGLGTLMTGVYAIELTPLVLGYNQSAGTTIFVSVTNKSGSTSAVSVSLKALKLEE